MTVTSVVLVIGACVGAFAAMFYVLGRLFEHLEPYEDELAHYEKQDRRRKRRQARRRLARRQKGI